MTQKERVAIIKTEFPGYDAPLDSKVMRPKQYGIVHCAKARELLAGAKTKTESDVYKFTSRISKEKKAELEEALEGKPIPAWFNEMVDRKIERFKKKKAAECGETLQQPDKNISTTV